MERPWKITVDRTVAKYHPHQRVRFRVREKYPNVYTLRKTGSAHGILSETVHITLQGGGPGWGGV